VADIVARSSLTLSEKHWRKKGSKLVRHNGREVEKRRDCESVMKLLTLVNEVERIGMVIRDKNKCCNISLQQQCQDSNSDKSTQVLPE